MRTIPLSQIPSQRLQVVLDDQNCTIALRWFQRWLFLDLWVGATAVVRGAICQNRADVLQSSSPDFSGTIHFWDTEANEPPRWDGLYNGRDGRWHCVFIPDGEEIPEHLEF